MTDNCFSFCDWEARWNVAWQAWGGFCPTHQEWTARLPDMPGMPWYEGEKMPGPGAVHTMLGKN